MEIELTAAASILIVFLFGFIIGIAVGTIGKKRTGGKK